jgi:integration host factor subunit beta
MTKRELIEKLYLGSEHLSFSDVELASKSLIDKLADSLADNQRIELRGFGSFCLNKMKAREGRNPKTGEQVHLPDRYVVYFRAGKELRERVDAGKDRDQS